MSFPSHPEDDEAKKRADRKARLYDAIRRQIEHEDGLVNQRFTWCLNSCGFLFAGYFLLITNNDKFKGKTWLLCVILMAICTLGILSCIIYIKTIGHAEESLRRLRVFWFREFKEERGVSNKTKLKDYPDIHYSRRKTISYKKALRIKKFLARRNRSKKFLLHLFNSFIFFSESGARGIINFIILIWV